MNTNTAIRIHPLKTLALALASMLMFACSDFDTELSVAPYDRPADLNGTRKPSEEKRHTFIVLSLGHNNLSGALQEDMDELKDGYIPGKGRNDNVLLIFSHRTPRSGSWSGPRSPVLERVYRDRSGKTVSDTLKVWEPGTVSASAETVRSALEYIRDEFPSASYGMLVSSHGTGYLPAGFYSNPNSYVFREAGRDASGRMRRQRHGVPYVEIPLHEGEPMVKSIGQDVQDGVSYEMELAAFADAIPMKMSYILMDMCFMGGIETAYELRGKCDMLGVSQTEVLANGFVYTSIGQHLLKTRTPNPQGICEDYFNSYNIQTGVYRSATISLIDCNMLDPLAEICAFLFDKYRTRLKTMDAGKVQRYYRYDYHWFYDLESIVEGLGATEDEMADFREALEKCIIYRNATPSFMTGSSGFDINVFSGFSMYLPSNGHRELDKYYRTLDWNKATALVE